MSEFIITNNSKVAFLDCVKAFEALTDKEKLYAHYFNRASWFGSLIVLLQVSEESPLIFVLLHKLFQLQNVDELKEIALGECELSEDEYTAFLAYSAAVFSNMANYRSFGSTKFVPNLDKDKFVKLFRCSKFGKTDPDQLERLLANCIEKVYSLTEKEKRLAFPENGTTKYLSKTVTKEDAVLVDKFLSKQGLEGFNTRLIKYTDETSVECFEIRLASILQNEAEESKELVSTHQVNGTKFFVTRGDYSPLLKLVNENLNIAKNYAANQNQADMIELYMKSFHTGSLDAHKDGSRFWIKDKGPIIETYIGFIETYKDPAGIRGEFRGFVAVVNKSQSKKFAELVRSAEYFLSQLPWPSTYEREVFLQPDFTNLDVLGFYSSGVPLGTNVPNYDVIRQNEGFKNLHLGNVMTSKPSEPPNFLCENDQKLVMEYVIQSFEVCTGLHELLGHGSGKLFQRKKDGGFNFDTEKVIHLETNEKITSWYEVGDTWGSVFGQLGPSYEECRAESVSLFLLSDEKLHKIFGYESEKDKENILYVGWLSMCLMGLTSIQFYDPQTNLWLQAHCKARNAILQVLLEGDDGFVKIEKVKDKDGNPDLLLTMDRSKIISVGRPKIGNFLKKLQLYKSTADVKSATAMYTKYTTLSNEGKYPFLEFRDIIMAHKKPRSMLVQATTFLQDGKVQLKTYERTFKAIIESWVDKLQGQNVDIILEELWAKDKEYF